VNFQLLQVVFYKSKKMHCINMNKISLQEIFLNNLKYYRKKSGFSQEALSERLDKGVNYINRIESHASFPTIQVIEEIAEVLNIQAYQLFKEDDVPKNIITSDRERFIKEVTESLYQKLSADMRSIIEKL